MNDHVFVERDGLLDFVGDFEGLYRADRNPWHQGDHAGSYGEYYHFSRQRIADALQPYQQQWQNALEIGCGQGHALEYLASQLRLIRWRGMDISETAIARARMMYPPRFGAADFMVGDIRHSIEDTVVSFKYDYIVLNQMLWYVLPDLDLVISNCLARLRQNGLLVVAQAFLTDQRYGLDIVNGFYGLVEWFRPRQFAYSKLKFVDLRYDDSGKYLFNDGLLVFRHVIKS